MPVFGLIDCAARPGLDQALAAEPEAQSLFAGPLAPELRAASPHIVRFAPGSGLAARLTGGDPGLRNTGVLCAGDCSLTDLRRMLRRWLQVMLPDGTVVMMRFYDPRVFPGWLAGLEPEALAAWFGPVTDWICPVPAGLRQFRLAGGVLQESLRPFATLV